MCTGQGARVVHKGKKGGGLVDRGAFAFSYKGGGRGDMGEQGRMTTIQVPTIDRVSPPEQNKSHNHPSTVNVWSHDFTSQWPNPQVKVKLQNHLPLLLIIFIKKVSNKVGVLLSPDICRGKVYDNMYILYDTTSQSLLFLSQSKLCATGHSFEYRNSFVKQKRLAHSQFHKSTLVFISPHQTAVKLAKEGW